MSSRGKFVVIEGSDGSGKTEQSKRLFNWLKNNKIPVLMFDFPRYGEFYGKLIGQRLAGKFGDSIPPEYCALPYAMDRLLAKADLEKGLFAGKFVVANRYIASNLAHMSAMARGRRRQEIIDWIYQMEYKVNGLVQEDITIFLHMPQKIAKRLIAAKEQREYLGKKGKDLHEANDDFMEKSIKQYLHLAGSLNNWAVIDCARRGEPKTIDEIHNEVLEILKKRKIIHNNFKETANY